MIRRMKARLTGFLKRNWKEFAYYGGVMLVLCALAYGAENYRLQRNIVETAPAAVSVELEAADEQAQVFVLPEDMLLINGFSAEPVWNGEQGCWQAHTAADFACEDVRAVCAGMVKTVGESGIYGGFAEVEHEEGMMRYCSIVPDAGLQVGDKVEAGDLIGRADISMPGEMHLGSHVHIEHLCSGEMQDLMARIQTSD